MAILDNFRKKDFPDQINLLTEIQAERDKEAIPDLFDLYAKPLNDTMIDHMVVTSLHTLLAEDEAETVRRIKSGEMREKALCINIAGMNRFVSSVPVLHSMIRNDKFKELHADGFFALAEIMSPESLPLFREYIDHPKEMLSSLAMKMVGQYADEESIDKLLSIVEEAEKIAEYETCSLQVGLAVESLAGIDSPKALAALVSRIHHRNATIRRVIHRALAKVGAPAIPLIAAVFDGDDIDEKIVAANVLGMIGHKLGGEVMVRALDAGKADHPNVRYAIFEAFGNIPFLKGLTCLVDALACEEDDLTLMAVVTALENQVSSGVIARTKELLKTPGSRRDKLIRMVIAAKAVSLFRCLYAEPELTPLLMEELLRTTDPEVLTVFKIALSKVDGEQAKEDLDKLCAISVPVTGRDVLVVDDSRAMLSFYGSVAQDLGLKILTAENGREALDIVELDQSFDLIITDMNMPVMDGLELTREIRHKIGNKTIPIIMVTTESEQSQRDMAKSAGVDAFITKPFTMQILREKLTTFFDDMTPA